MLISVTGKIMNITSLHHQSGVSRFHRAGIICTTVTLGFVFVVFNIPARAQMLDSLDRVMIDSSLILLNLRPDELGFEKCWVEDDTFRLAVVERYLSDPLALPAYIDETKAAIDSFSRKPLDLMKFFSDQLKVNPKAKSTRIPPGPSTAYDPQDPFKTWFETLEIAENYRRRFFADLDSLEIDDILMAAPGLWSEDEDSVKREIVGSWHREFGLEPDTSREFDSDHLLDLFKKLDMEALYQAGMLTLPAAQLVARGADESGCSLTPLEENIESVSGEVLYYTENKWGIFVIGGAGNNVYNGDFAGIIDLGGDDIYRGRCGAAMGVLGQPYSLLVDLSGNDYYDGNNLDVNQGAAFFGIGVLIDRNGDDTYRGGNYSQGAGLFGIGVLADHSGADDYRGGYFMQGAGHCGIGYLVDDGESDSDDRYLASSWAQGFASTFGYGLLFDSGGDDTYRTGGVYYHAPLLPHDYRSFSGGFGMGWRPRAGGGIGVLYDKGEGNDFYDAEVMSFGSSYWYSLGILIDSGGNDYYSLAHYGLGVGIHLSVGALYDMDGDDQYRSRHGVVGATPHDLSVGIMVDAGGDDSYIVSDGWGASLTNSCGLFIDRLGNDTYSTRGGVSFGKVRWARGFAGAGIFLDLEGDDVYPEASCAEDSSIWIQSGWGIGIDLPRDIIATEQEEKIGEITLTAEDSAKTIEELFEEASQWEVGSARESVARARKALLTKGEDVVRYIIAEKLDTRSSLVSRLLNRVVKAMPDTAGPLLIAKLPEAVNAENERILINTVSLLSAIKWKPAVDPLLDIVHRKSVEKARNTIIATLGELGDPEASDAVCRYVKDNSERRRITAINALRSLNDTSSIGTIMKGLDDPMFTVRSAAIMVISSFGINAESYLRNYIRGKRSKYPHLGLYSMGRIARNLADSTDNVSKEFRYNASVLFMEHLDNPDPHMRAEAVVALYRTGGDATRQIIKAKMENDLNPVVRAAFDRMIREEQKQ